MPRTIACLLSAIVVAALAPAAASASSVSVSGNTLIVSAGANEPNAVSVLKQAVYKVTDNGAALTAGAGCTAVNARQATCPLGTINLIRLNLGDLDDIARVTGSTNAQINGQAGTDELTGGGGNDTVDAGAGPDDRLFGNGGNDRLNAAESGGGNFLSGGNGDDTLIGATGPDVIVGGPFSQFEGGPGRDILDGGPGGDFLLGGPGPDDVNGGTGGIDIARYDDHTGEGVTVTANDQASNDGGASDQGVVNAVTRRDRVLEVEGLTGGLLSDTLTGSNLPDIIIGGSGDDTINGLLGADNLCGDGVVFIPPEQMFFSPSCGNASFILGADTLNGGDGSDLLMGNFGPDTFNGGTGTDIATYIDHSAPVAVTIGDAGSNDGQVDIDPVAAGNQPEGDRVAPDVENVSGGSGADSLTGANGANILYGGLGNDALNGGNGDDRLCGDDNQSFGVGLPVCGGTTFFGPPGPVTDVLNGGDGNDLLAGGAGPDTLTGGPGTDTATWPHAFTTGVTATLDNVANDGQTDTDPAAGNQSEGDNAQSTVENLIGSGGPDALTGSAAANSLSGLDGVDTLTGANGNDVLDPGPGIGDVVNGGGGADFGSYRFAQCPGCFQPGVTVTLDGTANDGTFGENDNIKADVEGLLGSRGGDTLTGQATAVANVFNGYEGNDTLNGNAGDDSLTGGRGTDSLFGGANADMLFSADGNIESNDCGTETDILVYDAGLDSTTNCETLEDGTATTAALALRAAVRAADAQHALVKSLR